MGAHLYNTASADLQLFYWREQSLEMDFVLRRGSRIIGIEVKTGSRRWNEASRSEFEKRFDPERCLLVGDEGVPLNEFLSVPDGSMLTESLVESESEIGRRFDIAGRSRPTCRGTTDASCRCAEVRDGHPVFSNRDHVQVGVGLWLRIEGTEVLHEGR